MEPQFADFWDAVNMLPDTGNDEEASDSEEDTDDDDGSPDDVLVDGSPDGELWDDVRDLRIAYRDLYKSFGQAREEIDEVKAPITQKETASKKSGNSHDPCSAEPTGMLGTAPKTDCAG